MADLLKVSNITVGVKRHDKIFNAIDNISFSVKEGEILGLAGESGCGKSMTVLSVSSLLPQTAMLLNGEIIYKGISLTSLSEKELCRIRGKEISVIFQEARQSLNPLIKVGNQIMEPLELTYGKKRNTQAIREENHGKVKQMLSLLGFEEPQKIFNAYPHQLSGGMCQRVMTAIAAICRPQLLLADEPSSSLDTESQERILSLLVKMNREYGMSVLIISHDLSIIRQFCSRYLIMYAGKIVEEGAADMLFSPLHPYTKALAGAIPGRDKRGKNLENIPGRVPSVEDLLSGCPFAPRCPKMQDVCLKAFPPAINTGNRCVYCYFPESGNTNE
jgi:oligopeptide/dipeptide ABC transporter ATP-binding protein